MRAKNKENREGNMLEKIIIIGSVVIVIAAAVWVWWFENGPQKDIPGNDTEEMTRKTEE